jgi:5-formyltetrahydrofolate cyclo-ligase
MSRKKRKEIRSEMSRIISRLDDRWIAAASRELSGRLGKLIDEELPDQIEHVLAWMSFFPGEVDLTAFIDEQLDKRRIYLPRTLPDRSMSFISIGKDWLTAMQTGQFGIPEPGTASGDVYDPSWARETAVITPGLAFDKEGGRLGRGAGYYDRFFASPPMMDSFKVGVCWSLQLVSEIPLESHDVTMDWICHEEGWIKSGFTYDEDFDE